MRVRACAVVVALATAVWAPPLNATDLEEYRRLSEAARGLLELIEDAEGEQVRGLREAAVAADLALIAWLDDYFTTEDFAELPAEQQAAARSDRYRWEHSLSVQLLALGRCEEARDRARRLLDGAYSDPELRPLLTESYARAVECVAEQEAVAREPSLVVVRVERVEPADAMVSIDQVPIGAAPLELELERGPHRIDVTAPEHEPWTDVFTAEGPEVVLAPIELAPSLPPVDASNSRAAPGWEHWTLWGVGLVGIGTGVGLYAVARDRESTVDDPPDGFRVTDEEHERDLIGTIDAFAYTSIGLGVAAAVAGTVLYLTSDESPAERDDRVGDGLVLGWYVSGGGAGLRLGGTFW